MADKNYWDGEWPNLNSISIVLQEDTRLLTIEEVGALYRLVWHCASQGVHSYYKTAPGPMCFPDDAQIICRLVGCTMAEWRKIKARVLGYFWLRDGQWHLRDENTVRLSKDAGRQAIPLASKLAAQSKGLRCAYCGDDEGPFDHDHMFPISRGGNDDPNNIVLACARCNRSKGARTLLEWMNSHRS